MIDDWVIETFRGGQEADKKGPRPYDSKNAESVQCLCTDLFGLGCVRGHLLEEKTLEQNFIARKLVIFLHR